uniref:Polyketide synthase n=1 Tax=Pestalotiopsis microspora TaxID=85828 RepID=A0A1P8NTJ3_PESMI|nr:polyketide synthase [Pestalotiopsis microspora]
MRTPQPAPWNGANGRKHNDDDDVEQYGNDDPCCIVGIGCRLPGGIASASDLWDFVLENKSGQGTVPAGRYNVDAFYGPEGSRGGLMNTNGGYFLQEDIRQFDNKFFGINNLETASMDPQQRKLLEVVYECFENAGASRDHVSGANIGVYVGNFTVDHIMTQLRDMDEIHRYSAVGCGTTLLANRISHVFNLTGPSFALDTACSSSLYCLHMAINGIKNGDCDGAIVASVNLLTTPEQTLATSKAGVISPTSTCHTFDASADGYGRAEGANAVYIKRLSSAIRDHDNVIAIIRGTAVNANGRTPGLTQPSADFQEAVIRKAYADARLGVSDTDYFECHGTGTPVGDPIEIDGISRCFPRREGFPLLIGSVKTNLGHSEAASGLTSLIKVAMSLSRVKLNELNYKVVTEVQDWPRSLRRASINSFGYGGANAHAIIEAVDVDAEQRELGSLVEEDRSHDPLLVLLLSADSPSSLDERLQHVYNFIDTCDVDQLQSLAYTLSDRTTQFKIRQFLTVDCSANSNSDRIKAEPMEGKNLYDRNPPSFGFIFTGQGSQYANMSKELLEHNATFIASIRKQDQAIRNLPKEQVPEWTLEQLIMDPPEKSLVNEVACSQPLCTAIQVALVDVLSSWGILPSKVIGHSSGEIAAAYAAGFIDAKQAILLAYFRGYAASKLSSLGAMMAAGVDYVGAKKLILNNGLGGKVCVACVNSPKSVTLSGTQCGIETLLAEIQQEKKFARLLRTNGCAYHSFMMKEIGGFYESLIAPILEVQDSRSSSTRVMYSSVGEHGEDLAVMAVRDAVLSASYWRENLEKPVQFHRAFESMVVEGRLHLIEIGPHCTLKGPVQQIRAAIGRNDRDLLYSHTLERQLDANQRMKQLAGNLFLCGHKLSWSAINSVFRRNQRPVQTLPHYPWDYSAGLVWKESRLNRETRNRKYRRHELLGSSQPGGPTNEYRWRNALSLSEVPWLADHKLESQIVFPAAAYLAMAIEALSQISLGEIGFKFQNVAISTALVIPETAETTELHTTVIPRRLSSTTVSSEWYEFAISSWKEDITTTHCVGSMCIAGAPDTKGAVEALKLEFTTKQDPSSYYDQFWASGLCFGPNFHSVEWLSVNQAKSSAEAVGAACLWPAVADHDLQRYPIHPITLDACLQAAIMSTAKGDAQDLKGYVPVFFSECQAFPIKAEHYATQGSIHVSSRRSGVSTQQISCTFLDPEQSPIFDFKNTKVTLLDGNSSQYSLDHHESPRRHPCLRVQWKPDIHHVDVTRIEELSTYVAQCVRESSSDTLDNESTGAIRAILDLLGHKNPQMKVLALGQSVQYNEQWKNMLGDETAFPRFGTWDSNSLQQNGIFSSVEKTKSGCYDVIILPANYATSSLGLVSLLNENGIAIVPKTASEINLSVVAALAVIEVGVITLLRKAPQPRALSGKDAIILVHEPSSELLGFAGHLSQHLVEHLPFVDVPIVSLQNFSPDLHGEALCISLVEAERSHLTHIKQSDLDRLKLMTTNLKNLVWITGAGNIDGHDPNLSLASGLSRAVMLEQPSLHFSIIDIGELQRAQLDPTLRGISQLIGQQDAMDDREFVFRKGLLYVSRFVPDPGLNSVFQCRIGDGRSTFNSTPGLSKPLRLAVGKPGVADSIHFREVRDLPTATPRDCIDVELRAASLNAKDVYALRGRVETQKGTVALEFSGIVTSVGRNVDHLRPGDRVVAIAPIHFTTTERIPAWAAHKILPHEQYHTMAALPVVYCTALYALHDRAHLRRGESILIHSGAGALGIAAITIAQRIGATVYTTVSSPTKKDFLVKTFGIPESNIFNSRDMSFVAAVKGRTGGKGVDVVLNSLVGELMHASWRCVADFGRFIEVGKKELLDAGRLDMDVFLRNVTFSAFDLSDLYYHPEQFYRDKLASKIREVLELYRSGAIQPMPTTEFDVSEMAEAVNFFSTKDRLGKVVISLKDENSSIQVKPAEYSTSFDPEKTYLLVGCLGGLGKSLTRWMSSRGARNFVFLGRSGCDQPAAQALVHRMQQDGATVIIVKGDVSNTSDVERFVGAGLSLGKPLGGVVQASMGLQESLFSGMTSGAWQAAIQPKVQGTWNLHTAVEGHDLDFFLLFSSVSGSVGTATESNYCAANAFLDSFTRWRRASGRPAASIGLGNIAEVGYLHENPEIEALLLRRGIQSLTEKEFLHVVDFALGGAGCQLIQSQYDPHISSHILTGLESVRVQELSEQGFEVTHNVIDDPRASVLAAGFKLHKRGPESNKPNVVEDDKLEVAWLNAIPAEVKKTFKSVADAPSLASAVLRLVEKRFSNLMLLPGDRIDADQPLAMYGVDSMIASEFRSWFWGSFRVDVPFLHLLGSGKSLKVLSNFIQTKLEEQVEGEGK